MGNKGVGQERFELCVRLAVALYEVSKFPTIAARQKGLIRKIKIVKVYDYGYLYKITLRNRKKLSAVLNCVTQLITISPITDDQINTDTKDNLQYVFDILTYKVKPTL